MATHRGSARRYAEAAFEIAERDHTVEAWLGDLDTAAAALGEGAAVHLLSNPAVPIGEREKVVRDALGERISDKAANLLLLLVRRGRADLMAPVAAEFRRIHDRREGISHATVTSAAPLDEAELAALRDRLTGMTGGRVEVTFAVDPALLGGVVVRIGDRLIDGSVRGRLERLRNRLAAGAL